MKLTKSKDASYLYVSRHIKDGQVYKSTFPHPLITLDWDKQGNLLGIEIISTLEIEDNDNG